MVESKRSLSNKLANASLLLAVAGCSLLVYFTPLKHWLSEDQHVRSWLAATGRAAPAVFVAATALLTAVGIPRLLLCSLGGLVFGFAGGFLWSHLGTVTGAYITFLFARWSGREFLLRKYPRLQGLSQPLEKRGWLSVLLIRQLPVSGLYNDILLGLSTVGHRDFWVGTAVGFLPLGVTATLIGSGAVQADMAKTAQYLGLAACLFLGLTVSLKWFLSQIQNRAA